MLGYECDETELRAGASRRYEARGGELSGFASVWGMDGLTRSPSPEAT